MYLGAMAEQWHKKKKKETSKKSQIGKLSAFSVWQTSDRDNDSNTGREQE